MKKNFFKYDSVWKGYVLFEGAQTSNFSLQNLYHALSYGICDKNLTSMQFEYLQLMRHEEKIYVWDSDEMKPMADVKFTEEYFNAYSEYSDKRWDDMPKLELTLKNYEEIIDKWEVIKNTKPTYIIFSQDDTGYVDLVGKNELSQQDIVDMKLEHEKYLKYDEAFKKYASENPNRSEVWRSPEDSEFEADWQKYLED